MIDNFYIPIQLNQNENNASFKGISEILIRLNNDTENINLKFNEVAVLNSITIEA